MTPFVSVVIPAHEDAARLQECVARLDRQSYPADRIQIIVVDNASDPPLEAPVTRRVPLRLIREPVPGSYRARNSALPLVDGEIVAFTDSDCLPAEDWIERGVMAVAGEPLVMVGGHVQVFPAEPQRPTAVELWEQATGFPQERYLRQERFAVTANLFTTTEVLAQVGPFNERLASGGDYEWGRRAAAAGVKQKYAADVVVRHPARRTMSEIRGKLRRTVRGRVALEDDPGGLHAPVSWARRLAPPLSGWWTILRSPELQGASQRLKAGAVMTAVKYLTAFEYMAARPARGTALKEEETHDLET